MAALKIRTSSLFGVRHIDIADFVCPVSRLVVSGRQRFKSRNSLLRHFDWSSHGVPMAESRWIIYTRSVNSNKRAANRKVVRTILPDVGEKAENIPANQTVAGWLELDRRLI